MLTLELQELFFSLEDLFLFDGFALGLGILENLLLLAFQYEVSDQDAAQDAEPDRNQCG